MLLGGLQGDRKTGGTHTHTRTHTHTHKLTYLSDLQAVYAAVPDASSITRAPTISCTIFIYGIQKWDSVLFIMFDNAYHILLWQRWNAFLFVTLTHWSICYFSFISQIAFSISCGLHAMQSYVQYIHTKRIYLAAIYLVYNGFLEQVQIEFW